MATPLISTELNDKLNNIVTKMFEGNRICDRAMSVLSVKFALTQTVSFLHPRLAHLFPLLADKVSDFQGERDCLTIYGMTPLDSTDYMNVMDFFKRMLEYMEDVETLVGETLDYAKDEDPVVYAFLLHFIRKLVPITNQILLLIDKLENYGDNPQGRMLFDAHVENFIILDK